MCWTQSVQTLGCCVDPVPDQYILQSQSIEYIRINETAALLPLLLAVIFALCRSSYSFSSPLIVWSSSISLKLARSKISRLPNPAPHSLARFWLALKFRTFAKGLKEIHKTPIPYHQDLFPSRTS